jgi:phospho-N-acetylmuramoyl-pentapeptide-transferase
MVELRRLRLLHELDRRGTVAAVAAASAVFVALAAYLSGHGGLTVLLLALATGCVGFLVHNWAPARIFMGDTGSLALGGLLGALAITTSTQLLLVILGGLFVLETTSVIVQVVSFRFFHRRLFRMAPVHHHFELAGWHEFTVIVRFWIVAGLSVAFGLGLFYADFLARGGNV